MAYDEETLEVFHGLTDLGLEEYQRILDEKENQTLKDRIIETIVKIFKD